MVQKPENLHDRENNPPLTSDSGVPDGETKNDDNGQGAESALVDVEAMFAARKARLEDIEDGPYYLAPDSAPPIPDEMERQVDPKEVRAALKQMTPDRRGLVRTGEFWALSAAERASLEELGGTALKEALLELFGPNGHVDADTAQSALSELSKSEQAPEARP